MGEPETIKMMPGNSIITVRQWQIQVSGRISAFLQSTSANYSATTHTHPVHTKCSEITLRSSPSRSDLRKTVKVVTSQRGSHTTDFELKVDSACLTSSASAFCGERCVRRAVRRRLPNARVCVFTCFSRDNGH